MRIVFTTKSFHPMLGGSIVYCSMLASAFSRAGHDVTVITRTPGDDITDRNYNLLRQPSTSTMIELAGKTDILIQVEASWADAWPYLLRRVPWFPSVHRGNVPLARLGMADKVRMILERLAYRCGHTIGVSNYVVDSWKLREAAIPNPYDPEIFYESNPEVGRDIDVLFVGRMTRDKGVFILLEALENLVKTNDPRLSRVAFVGAGPVVTELRERANHSLPGLDLLFPGQLGSKEVADLMRRSKVLAFPTTPDWLEASPLTPLEATACGCLVVAANSGGTRENVSPDHWVVESGSVTEFQRGLNEALGGLRNFDQQATKDLLQFRTLTAVASQYLDRFGSALKTRSPR